MNKVFIVSFNGNLGLFDKAKMNCIKPLDGILFSFFGIPMPKIVCVLWA
jgi:hypothetical protein